LVSPERSHPGGGVGFVAAVTMQGSSNTAIADNVVNDSTS
jgi:hypothetical protein